MTNEQIYTLANDLMEHFNGEIVLPVKVNFYLQKNIKSLLSAAQLIEEARLEIAKRYGELDEEQQFYNIPEEKMAEANRDLRELFELEQDIAIAKVSIEDFGNINLSIAQLNLLDFMIKEE